MNSSIQIVDEQLEAYNRQDFESFAACYHREIISYDLDTHARIEDMCGENFFSYYEKKFRENPQIFCEVTDRIVHDNLVIDKELISLKKGNHREMVIYKIEDGLISKMWFTKEIIETGS